MPVGGALKHIGAPLRVLAAMVAQTLAGLTVAVPAYAQTPDAAYRPSAKCTPEERLRHSGTRACEQIDDSLNKFSERGEKLSRQTVELFKTLEKRTVRSDGKTFEGVPMENPLDKNNGNEGGRAWEEYSHDSKLALNDTFMGCLEPRLITAGQYEQLCQQICPEFVKIEPGCPACEPDDPGCQQQTHMTIEYYLPVHQMATNKAGARSLNPNMFSGFDNDPRLSRSATAQHEERRDKSGVADALEQLGLDTKALKWPEWHKPGQEFHLQGNNESLDVGDAAQSFPIGYQTLLHAHATRDRPTDFFLGWALEPKSALWCFDKPDRKVVTNSMDHGDGVYSLLARIPELTQVAWPEAYRATVNEPWNLAQAGTESKVEDFPEPAFRRARWRSEFDELKEVGVEPQGDAQRLDWVFFGGTLAPFTVGRFNTFTDPIQADLFRMTTAALLFGSQRGAFAAANTGNRRHLQFTRYTGRFGDGRSGYTGSQGGVRDSIRTVDKIQLAYPPLEEGDPRRGSQCFRIENLGNSEPGTSDKELSPSKTQHVKLPRDLRAQFLEHGWRELNRANETRMLIWDKRVMCACEKCGRPFGCTTLNNGDFEQDAFEGTVPFNTPPPPLQEVLPFLQQYARKTSPPPTHPPIPDIFNIPASDTGSPGPNPGFAPPGFAAQPSVPTIPPIIPPQPAPPSLACPFSGGGAAKRRFGRAGFSAPATVDFFVPVLLDSAPDAQSKAGFLMVPNARGHNCLGTTCEYFNPTAAAPFKDNSHPPDGTKLCWQNGTRGYRCSPFAGRKAAFSDRRARSVSFAPVVTSPGSWRIESSRLARDVNVGSIRSSINAANQGVVRAAANYPNQLQSALANNTQIASSLEAFGSNTIGAGNQLKGSTDGIINGLNDQIKTLNQLPQTHEVKQLKQQLEQLKHDVKELEEEEKERQEGDEEKEEHEEQHCAAGEGGGGEGGGGEGGGGGAGQIIAGLLQGLLQGLLSGGGGNGGNTSSSSSSSSGTASSSSSSTGTGSGSAGSSSSTSSSGSASSGSSTSTSGLLELKPSANQAIINDSIERF